MYELIRHDEFIEVQNKNGNLVGALRKGVEGFYELHPARKVVIDRQGLIFLVEIIGNLNMFDHI